MSDEARSDGPASQTGAVQPAATVDLSAYDHRGYHPGRGPLVRLLWYACNAICFASWLVPFSGPKRWLLRRFGATVGRGVVIKPRVNIKHPWRLRVGDHCWIGEGAWIDNLLDVSLGDNVCVSQNAYLLTGNHDYKDRRFGFLGAPVVLGDGSWVGAFAIVCPGAELARNSILTVASVLRGKTEPDGIHAGNPATRVRERRFER
jgi:putative colanic acid biosynthesis acetyltransferase WcaF